MSYDAWKTRSPDDDEYDEYDEEGTNGCAHPVIDWSMWTGQGTCRRCKDSYPEWTMTVPERVRHAWFGLRWWCRWTAWEQINRPWRAVRYWWRGDRKAPWKPDDEVPF